MRKLGLLSIIIGLFFFALSSLAFAEQPKLTISRKQAAEFISWLNAAGSFKNISPRDISARFADNFKFYTNGTLAATDANSLYQRFMLAKKQYQGAYIHFPITDFLVDGNKAAAKFLVTFISSNGQQRESQNTIIVKFNKQGKVEEFSQAFDKGSPLPS